MISDCETKIKHSEYQSPDDSFILQKTHNRTVYQTKHYKPVKCSLLSDQCVYDAL